MSWVAGVDGCKAGWIAALRHQQTRTWHFHFAPTLCEIANAPEKPSTIAVDMPMGFLDRAERGGRLCEREARTILRKRGCCVFSTPVRPALAANDYKAAVQVNRSSAPESVGFSIQAWHIIPKMREVDDALRNDVSLRSRVFEAHPELTFARLNGGQPVLLKKTKSAGRRARLDLLASVDLPDISERLAQFRKANRIRSEDVADDDAIDAIAVCLTAERIQAGIAVTLPREPPCDSQGIEMAIRY